MGEQWPAVGTGALAVADLGGAVRGLSPLGGVAISPTTEPPSSRSTSGGKLYQGSSHTVAKALGPTTDFPTGRYGKGTENLQGI